jgi:hypothetical protein
MKRRQFVKLISASIVAGVVAPVCVLPKQNNVDALQGGESVINGAKPYIYQEGKGEWVALEDLNTEVYVQEIKYRLRMKYGVTHEGHWYIRYLGDEWTATKQ